MFLASWWRICIHIQPRAGLSSPTGVYHYHLLVFRVKEAHLVFPQHSFNTTESLLLSDQHSFRNTHWRHTSSWTRKRVLALAPRWRAEEVHELLPRHSLLGIWGRWVWDEGAGHPKGSRHSFVLSSLSFDNCGFRRSYIGVHRLQSLFYQYHPQTLAIVFPDKLATPVDDTLASERNAHKR